MYPIDFFWRAAHRYSERPAIVSVDQTLTYAELSKRVICAAGALASRLSLAQTPVCLGAANTVDHLIAILAILAANKTWVPLNPRNGDPELRRIVEFVEPSLVIVDDSMRERLSSVGSDLFSLSELASDALNDQRLPVSSSAMSLSATQAIKFTGGTTGFPKGVMQPLRAWNANIVTQFHELQLNPDDRYLVAAPLTHGTSTYILPILGSGGAMVFPQNSDVASLLDAAETGDVTIFFAPPTLVLSLIAEQRKRPRALPKLRYLVYGGAPMRPEQIRDAQSVFGPVVCTSYGQTEAPQVITFLPPFLMSGERLSSVGRPTLFTEVGILSKEGRPLPIGDEGEIAVRGDLVMSGYFKAEEETRRTLVDGWLRTGDMGVLDTDGFLFIKDRIRDVIITGGFNVYPSDVELVMSRYAPVADCSIVGIPDTKWGEAVHAAVQVRPGSTFDADELVKLVKRELGSVKTPKQVHLFEMLPRSPVGKVLKAAIREEIIRRQGR